MSAQRSAIRRLHLRSRLQEKAQTEFVIGSTESIHFPGRVFPRISARISIPFPFSSPRRPRIISNQEVQMRITFRNPVLFLSLCVFWIGCRISGFAQTQNRNLTQLARYQAEDSGFFPNPLGLYREKPVPRLRLENSKRIENLIHDGSLELSLSDALALALENNLDIAVQRFVPEFSQTDLLRSQAGQSPRGKTVGAQTYGQFVFRQLARAFGAEYPR